MALQAKNKFEGLGDIILRVMGQLPVPIAAVAIGNLHPLDDSDNNRDTLSTSPPRLFSDACSARTTRDGKYRRP